MSAVRTTCPYCGVGCGLVASAPFGGAPPSIVGDRAHPANRGRVCSKGAALGDTLGLEGRLLHPEVRGRRTSWDDALDVVADGFRRTIEAHGPDAVAFYVSGQLLTEDYYVANKLMKGFIGSANIDTNSRLCMASAVAGYKRAFGEDVVPSSYDDLEQAELTVIVGSNMAWCHPVLYQRLSAAKSADPAKRVVVIDPRRTATCEIADLFLPLKPGTDVVLFNGLLSYLRREDALDWEFLDAHTEGFGAALRVAKESAPSVPAVAAACGLEERDVAELYRLFQRTPKVSTLFSQGVNQSTSGTDKVNAIVNVHLATGRIGKPGAGPFSLTGQPNAMGGREVGGLANQLAAHMDFAPEHVERVRRFWGSAAVAARPGLKAVELFEALREQRVRAIWIMATNPVVSMPDADAVAAALEACDLVVVSDCVRRTDTALLAHVLLPAAAWGEKSGTVTNSERRISRQRAFLPPVGQSRPDWWIVSEVARRMGFAEAFPYASPAAIFREHARLSAFENDGARAFDIGALATLTDEEYDRLEPVQWPLPAAPGPWPQEAPFAAGRFCRPSGRAALVATAPKAPAARVDAERPLLLNTGRLRDQWHTMTRSGRSARLFGHAPEPRLQVHPSDAAHAGVTHGELVVLSTERGRCVLRVDVSADVQPGHVFAPIHWSAQFASGGRVGALIAPATDPHSGQPELKHTPVALEPLAPAWYAFAISREPLELPACDYVARAPGADCWRYELAGATLPSDWRAWARALLGADGHWIELCDPGAGRYRGARLVDERLVACLFAAPVPRLPSRSWLAELFAAGELTDSMRMGLLTGKPADGAAERGPIVCACFAVGRTTLVNAIRSRSLLTPAAIGEALAAGTNCGSCVPELKALIAATVQAVD